MLKPILRYAAAAVALTVAVFLFAHRDHGGNKGMEVPLDAVLICILASAATALVVRRYNAVAAPFAAGIIGVFACGPNAGPYGGAMGLAVGTATVLLMRPPFSVSRRNERVNPSA